MVFIGVDGCSQGWFTVLLKEENKWEINVFSDIFSLWDEVWQNYGKNSSIFIDIPIGLKEDGNGRQCDLEARKILGRPRSSSVFPTPCRQIINIRDYDQASIVNKRITGKGISLPTWHIIHKIREVDNLMLESRNARQQIREIHPEICFWSFAGRPMKFYKKEKNEIGFHERRKVLEEVYPTTNSIVHNALATYKRKDVAKDDILDALSAVVTAKFGSHGLESIPKEPEDDSNGLRMEMVHIKRYFL